MIISNLLPLSIRWRLDYFIQYEWSLFIIRLINIWIRSHGRKHVFWFKMLWIWFNISDHQSMNVFTYIKTNAYIILFISLGVHHNLGVFVRLNLSVHVRMNLGVNVRTFTYARQSKNTRITYKNKTTTNNNVQIYIKLF